MALGGGAADLKNEVGATQSERLKTPTVSGLRLFNNGWWSPSAPATLPLQVRQAELFDPLRYHHRNNAERVRKNSPGVAIRRPVRCATALVKCFVLCVSNQSGLLSTADSSTGTSRRGGETFAVVRDLDPLAKQRVQAILRRSGRGRNSDLTILTEGEDGLRGVVGR